MLNAKNFYGDNDNKDYTGGNVSRIFL